MLSPVRMLSIGSSRIAFGVLLTCPTAHCVFAQDKSTHSILTIEDSSTKTSSSMLPQAGTSNAKTDSRGATMTWSGSVPSKLASSGKGNRVTQAVDHDAELVRDRYANGKPHVERRVTLDAEGNYVNHGDYREFSDKGDLLVTGSFQNGQRVGVWAKFLNGTESQLLKSYPFTKMRPPFTSSVEFHADQMHGTWVISDRDKRIACQIELQQGQRHGLTTFFHPNGQVHLQATYVNGVLEGLSTEKSAEGKVVHEDIYTAGRKQVVDTEYYNNKSVKSVTRYLTGVQRATQSDNWVTTSLAAYTSDSDRELHGDFITYHENGQVATKGSYQHGQLHGPYEAWYRTGDLSASGSYDHGEQDGQWIWRHSNGMKRATSTFQKGKVQGETRAWDEKGKAISSK